MGRVHRLKKFRSKGRTESIVWTGHVSGSDCPPGTHGAGQYIRESSGKGLPVKSYKALLLPFKERTTQPSHRNNRQFTKEIEIVHKHLHMGSVLLAQHVSENEMPFACLPNWHLKNKNNACYWWGYRKTDAPVPVSMSWMGFPRGQFGKHQRAW